MEHWLLHTGPFSMLPTLKVGEIRPLTGAVCRNLNISCLLVFLSNSLWELLGYSNKSRLIYFSLSPTSTVGMLLSGTSFCTCDFLGSLLPHVVSASPGKASLFVPLYILHGFMTLPLGSPNIS